MDNDSATGAGLTSAARSRRATPTFYLIGVISEVPIWAFYLVAIVWWVEELQLSAYQLLMLGFALEVAALVSEVPTGVIADRFSRAGSVMVSFLLIGLSMLIHAATELFWVLMLSQVVLGLGWTFRSGADVAWFTDQFPASEKPGEQRRNDIVSRAVVRRQLVVLIATAVSVPGFVAVGMWSLRGAIALCGILAIVGGVAVSARLGADAKEGNPVDDATAAIASGEPPPSMRSIFRKGREVAARRPVVRRLLAVVFVVGLGEDIIDRLGYAKFLLDGDFDDSSLAVAGGLFVVVALGGAAATRLVENQLERGVNVAALATGLMVTSAVGMAMVAVLPVAGIAIGLMIADSARETLYPVIVGWVNPHTNQESRATVHSFLSLASGLGVATGSLVAAGIAWVGGVNPALWWAAAAFGCGAILATSVRRISP